MSSNLSIITSIADLELDDYIVILKDDCFQRITVEEYLKLFQGGINVCASIEACNTGIGVFEDDVENPEPHLPTMQDIYVSLSNRAGVKVFTSQEFTNNYYDADGDVWQRIIITSGDLTGVTFNNQPVYIGLVIYANEISQFKYNTKDVDYSYRQNIGFKLYNDKNEEAI